MHVRFLGLALCCFCLHLTQIVTAGLNEVLGYPPIIQYAEPAYLPSFQVWDIEQDQFGRAYFASNNGIIRYDGVNWHQFQLPVESSIRSMALSAKGDLYLGAENEFGFFASQHQGKYEYHSLSDSLSSKPEGPVYKTFAQNGTVYFEVGHHSVYEYKNQRLAKLNLLGLTYFRSFLIDDNLILVDTLNGFYKLSNNQLVKYPCRNFPKDIYYLSAYNENYYLIATLRNGLFLADKQNFDCTRFHTVADQSLMRDEVYVSAQVNDDLLAIGTLKNGVYLIDKAGQLKWHLTKQNGLQHNSTFAFYVDKAQNLWVAHEKGASVVQLGSRFTQFTTEQGIDGNIHNFCLHNQTLYCGSSAGLFSCDALNYNQRASVFKPVNPNFVFCLDMLQTEITNKPEKALIASFLREVTYIDEQNKIHSLLNLYACQVICQSETQPDILYLGSSKGLSELRLRYENGKILTRKHTFYNAMDEPVERLVSLPNGQLWMKTSQNKVFCVQTKSGANFIESNLTDLTPSLAKYNDLFVTGIYYINQRLYLTTNQGIFSQSLANLEQPEPLILPDSVFMDFHKQRIRVESMGENNLGNIIIGLTDGYYEYDIHKKELSDFISLGTNQNRIFEIQKYNHQICGLITNNAIYFITSGDPPTIESRSTIITSVVFGNQYLAMYNDNGLLCNNEHQITIPFSQNDAEFSFAVPSLLENANATFYYKLEGFDADWRGPDQQNTVQYTNLKPGNYKFKVKGIINGQESKPVSGVGFRVQWPWYAYPVTVLGYLVVFIALVYLALRYKTRQLRIRELQLTQKVEAAIEKERKQLQLVDEQRKSFVTINQQLENLSLVASKTDNAVIIMDANGNIEWINEGYTRLYGYTLEELKESGLKIVGQGAQISVFDMVNVWFGNKKPIVYQHKKSTKEGVQLWAQTTLTPVINEQNRLIKLIAIETDISKLKQAEAEIEMQKRELANQFDIAIMQRDEITRQKKELTDSIEYARRIQRAALFSKSKLIEVFPESFVFYQARDIVSGDFYWTHQQNQYKYIAAVDCTGHGVPGAFMSLLAITLLNQLVFELTNPEPSELLNQLRQKLVNSLGQKGNFDEASDGLDISLCRIDTEQNYLLYSGANQLALIVRENGIEDLEPNHFPIGISQNMEQPFTQSVYEFKVSDTLYLFTDGITDQFNALTGEKYKVRRLKQLLLKIQEHPIVDQNWMVEKEFNSWKGNGEQIDDVLIIGIRRHT